MKNASISKSAFLGLFCLIAVSAAPSAHANLITNGGFETGDFSGWTQVGNTGFTGVDMVFSGVAPHNGAYQAY